MGRRLLICLLLSSTALTAADKTTETLLEVLRDIGGLQEQLKALEKSLDGKIDSLGLAGADQAHAAADQAAKSMAALAVTVQKSLQGQQDQQSKTLDAVAAVASQVQAIADQVGTMRQAVNDLTAATSRLTTQVNDLSAAVKSAQAKPDAGTAQPQLSATDLFANAEGDRLGGKLDLALQEYTGYATKFANTAQAPDAQYYVGSILYSNREWADAVKAFNTLLQTYPDSKRVPESLYYKADSLARLGQWQEANDTYKDLRQRFPDNPLAVQGLTVKQPK